MPACVYCGNDANAREHWLPRAFGTFGELQVLHQRLCEECNQALGQDVDSEFLRVGPEAVFRSGLGIEGRKRDEPTQSPYYFRAASTQPLRAMNEPSDDLPAILWETYLGPKGEPQARPLQQLVIMDANGRRRLIPYNVEWTADTLRVALRNHGIEGRLIEVYLDPEHKERSLPILSAVFPGFSADHFARSGAGGARRTLLFANRVGPGYFRGLTKIAFHAALKFIPNLRGDEWEFGSLRNFIRHGELPIENPAQRVQQPIIAGIGDGVTLQDWSHVIAVETDYRHITARLQFFVGPSAVPPVWAVRLARRPSHVAGDQRIAYLARYFEQRSAEGLTGEMVLLASQERS